MPTCSRFWLARYRLIGCISGIASPSSSTTVIASNCSLRTVPGSRSMSWWRRRHPFHRAWRTVRSRAAALHGLHCLPRPRAVQAARASWTRSRLEQLGGPGGHVVHYFVAGGQLVNFVAVKERETWTRESWTDHGEVGDALAAFQGTRRFTRSSARWTRPSSGHCLTAPRSNTGRSVGSPSWAMPARRCCRSWRRAPPKPSRMVRPARCKRPRLSAVVARRVPGSPA